MPGKPSQIIFMRGSARDQGAYNREISGASREPRACEEEDDDDEEEEEDEPEEEAKAEELLSLGDSDI